MIEKHYRTRDVAELLSCHEETVLRLAQTGKLESIRLGGERRYPESGIRRFLEAAREPAARQQDAAAVVPIARRRDDRTTRPRRSA